MPFVSIVITSYNYADLLSETLESISAQGFRDFEVIIVDDGSSDSSLEIATEYGRNHGNVRVLTHPGHVNKGISETVRLGVENAIGEFVTFCESDDLWTPNHLAVMVAAIKDNPDVGLLSNGVELFGDDEAVRARQPYIDCINGRLSDGYNFVDISNDVFFNVIPTMSAVMVRRSLIAGLDFKSIIPGWIDFWLYRQLEVKTSLFYVREKLTLWRQHKSANDAEREVVAQSRRDEFIFKNNRIIGIADSATASHIKRFTGLHSKTFMEEDDFRAVKRCFHDPAIGNADAKMLLDSFCEHYPGSSYINKLKGKFIWHRIVNRWKYGKYGYGDCSCSDLLNMRKCEDTYDSRDVLLVSHELSLTGAPRALMNMAVTLKRSGLKPVILSMKGGELIAEAQGEGIPVVVAPMLCNSMFAKSPLADFMATFPTIVFNTMIMVLKTRFLKNVKAHKIGWIHEGSETYRVIDPVPYIAESIRSLNEVYVVGEYAKKLLLRYTDQPGKVHNLLYGIDGTPATSACGIELKEDGKLRLLMAGSIDQRKGADILTSALQKLHPDIRSQIIVYIAGDSTDKELASRLGRLDVVRMLGQLPHDCLLDWIDNIDVMICPSIDDPMPIVCTEAMQRGKAVLTTSNTGTAAFIENGVNGFLVPAGDIEALATGIETVVAMRENLSDIGRRGREIYNKYFTMDVFHANLCRIFGLNQESA